ncbi:MAG: four helix bundle protein [Patescibacteria group bacterium]
MFKFETLEVWKKSQKLCNDILEDIKVFPVEYRYTIGNNLIRAAISVSNNIAEGSGRKGNKEANNFYNIAKGSVYEVVNVFTILFNKDLIKQNRFKQIYQQSEEISKMLTGLMKNS